MAGDDFRAAADDDLVDIAADLNLVMSAGDRNRVIVVAIAERSVARVLTFSQALGYGGSAIRASRSRISRSPIVSE